MGEAGQNQKGWARKIPKSPAAKVARYGGFPKKQITVEKESALGSTRLSSESKNHEYKSPDGESQSELM